MLERLHDSGVRRCIAEGDELLPLALEVDITLLSVLPLRLALLGDILGRICPGGLSRSGVTLRCGRGGELTARAAALCLASRARYLTLDMADPAPLEAELLYRFGVSRGSGALPSALTVLCGDVPAEETPDPVLYLTPDCHRYQTLEWTSPRCGSLPVPATESLAAALLLGEKWTAEDIHVTSLLDIRRENHYNAT